MTPPNIVLIVMDAARADRTSVHGYHRPTTPCLEQIAQEGVVFDQAISAAAWTIPSHATFFTGRYPSEHGANHHRLGEGTGPLLAEILKAAGYHTLAVVSNVLLHPDTGLARGFDSFHRIGDDPERMRGLKPYRSLARGLGWRDSGAELVNRRAAEMVQTAGSPFFLFLNYMESHFPFLPPPRFRRRFAGGNLATWRRLPLALQFMKGRYWSLLRTADAGAFALLSDLYDGEVAYLDHMIGEFTDWLDRRALLGNTILIITSDHGENLGHHGLLTHHFCLYDSLIHLPLVVSWPDRLPRAARTSAQVSSADLLPGLCRALGLTVGLPDRPGRPRPSPFEWDSLADSQCEAYAEYVPPFYLEEWARNNPEVDLGQHSRRLWAVRAGGRKYIEGSDGRSEWYNLDVDPEEMDNLADSREQVGDGLPEIMKQWREAVGAHAAEDAGETDSELMARLRSLGYV